MSVVETVSAPSSEGMAVAIQEGQTLRDCVERAMQGYFNNLEGTEPSEVYDLVLVEIEKPLLESVMMFTRGNQSRAAIILGLSRGTLRKKLKQHGLL